MQEKKLTIATWIDQYKEDYLAHAIWQDNVDKVLSSGKVMSAEHVLRTQHNVSYESGSGYGERGLKVLSEILFKTVKKHPLPPLLQLKNNYVKKYRHSDVVDIIPVWFEIATIFNNEEIVDSFNDTLDKIKNESEETLPISIKIVADMLSENPIDKRLAAVWDANVKKGENAESLIENFSLLKELYQARYSEIPVSKLSIEIRALFCSIAWGYGDVVVLRGNIKNIVNYEPPLKKGAKVYTPVPFQNQGEFFTLDLKNEDTIILGPQYLLEKYRNASYPYNIFYFEELSCSQLDFFNVPESLRESKQSLLDEEDKNKIIEKPLSLRALPIFFKGLSLNQKNKEATPEINALDLHESKIPNLEDF